MISDGEACYVGPNFQYNARAFMTEHDRTGQRNRPIRDRQIAVADTAGGELEQHFAAPWCFHDNRLDDRGATLPADDRLGFHAGSMPASCAAFNAAESHSAARNKPLNSAATRCGHRLWVSLRNAAYFPAEAIRTVL